MVRACATARGQKCTQEKEKILKKMRNKMQRDGDRMLKHNFLFVGNFFFLGAPLQRVGVNIAVGDVSFYVNSDS